LDTLTISSIFVLAGVCLYAAISHLSVALRKPFNKTHFHFAFLCLAVAFLTYAQTQAYQAHSVAVYISALRWNLALILIAFIFLAWFIADFTRVQPKVYLIGITLLFSGLFLQNLYAPYTLQYSEITHLKFLHLPWGEVVTEAVGRNGLAFKLGVLAVLITFGFAIYSLVRSWRREHRRTTLAMLLAIAIFLLAGIEGIGVRSAAINFIHLGWFGFLAMVVMMSVVLNHDTQKRLRDSERRFRSLVEQSPFSIQVLSPDGHTRQVNPAWEQLWGVKLDDIACYNILEDQQLKAKGIMPYIAQGFAGKAAELPPVNYNPRENTTLLGPESKRWVRSYIYPITDETNTIHDVILMHEDVTDRKRVEDAIRLIAAGVSSAIGDQFFKQLVLNLSRVFDADYTFIAMQDRSDPNRINTLAICANGKIDADRSFNLAGSPFGFILQQGTSIYSKDVQFVFPGDRFLSETNTQALIGTPLHDNEYQIGLLAVLMSKPLTYVKQAREIIEIFAVRAVTELHRQRTQAHIRHLAYQDYLTGLANRAQMHEYLTTVLRRARQTHIEGALLLIDLDHFKTINDALGHDVGDDVLRAVANRIRESCNDNVFLARLGGDEFVALLESAEHDIKNQFQQSVLTLAQRIMAQLASPVFAGDRAFTIGASIGIVHFPEDGETDLDVLRHADMALYHAKNKGRGNIQVYLPDLEIAATNRLQLEAGLRHAITQQELELYFQPQVNADYQTFGAEVLLRWHHPEFGDIPPSAFIPVAEDTGLIHNIGAWVFHQACASLTRWLQAGLAFDGHLSINVCPWQFARPDFVADVREALQKHQVDPQHLMLELTETALLYDLNEAIEKLKSLRQLGLRIALDDFGTGYSSLAYLRDLPLDQLKIDKNFVSELSSTVEHPLVGSMIAIGKHMKLAVVAEGVETESQRDKLSELGCEHFQGFLFCHPLPEQEFVAWLNDNKHLPRQTAQKS
jgi:diguanylate cyclase (GGDEF)-like protein/PAS domain S-box-containing protein